MDFPPGIAVLANLGRTLFGESPAALRVLPGIASAALALLAGAIARELGAGRAASALAAAAVAASPFFLRTGGLFQPVAFDQLAWTLAILALVRLSRAPTPAAWAGLGLALGLGLLIKFTILLIGAGIGLGLVLGPLHRSLRSRGPWAAAAIALLIGLPSIVGQLRLGIPLLLQVRGLEETQLAGLLPGRFLLEQLVFGPTTVLAGIGLGALFVHPPFARFRSVGIAALAAFGLVFAAGGKAYYAGPLYPALAGVAAAFVDQLTGPVRRRAFVAITLLLVGYGLVAFPVTVPVLPPPRLAALVERLDLDFLVRTSSGRRAELIPDFADMLGWPERAAAVARVYHHLAPAERREAVILAGNYGQAGALGRYGPGLGLPYPVSAAGTFWQFGPGPGPARVAVSIGLDPATLGRWYRSVTVADIVDLPWTVPEERGVPILIGREPRIPLASLWPTLAGRYR
jgi:hypothetical protein